MSPQSEISTKITRCDKYLVFAVYIGPDFGIYASMKRNEGVWRKHLRHWLKLDYMYKKLMRP